MAAPDKYAAKTVQRVLLAGDNAIDAGINIHIQDWNLVDIQAIKVNGNTVDVDPRAEGHGLVFEY